MMYHLEVTKKELTLMISIARKNEKYLKGRATKIAKFFEEFPDEDDPVSKTVTCYQDTVNKELHENSLLLHALLEVASKNAEEEELNETVS